MNEIIAITPNGIYRAVIERDEYPDEPDYEMACPVLEVDRSGLGMIRLGEDSHRHDGIDAGIETVWDTMRDLVHVARRTDRYVDTVDLVDRYLRIFHGGSAKLISSTYDRGGDDYLVYDTRAMRESWGQTGETLETSRPEAEEWQAYIDGEVYVTRVDKACEFDLDGEPVEWIEGYGEGYYVGGYYGEDVALEAARERLAEVIADDAADMLPLEV